MVTWYAQEHPTSCVAACVRMVLTSFDADWTEAQVRALLGRSRLGLTLTAACTRLGHAGAMATRYGDWNLDDLREALHRNRYPIVGVERHLLGYPPASHAVVVIRITSRRISVLDPLDGPHPQHYSVRTFELAWQLAGREVLLLDSLPRRPSS